MTLIYNWRKIWLKLWSVKLSLIAAFLSGLEVAFSVWIDNKPALFAAVAFVLSIGAAAARIVAQPKAHE